MAFVHLYSGSDGESHFEEFDLPLEPADLVHQGSYKINVSTATFYREMTGQSKDHWHRNTQPTYILFVSGMIEMEVGSGEKRCLGPGDILLEEDMTGRGHRARVVSNEPLIVLDIKLAD